MKKIKKKGQKERERERDGQKSGEEGKGDERGGKTSRDIFRKELGKPKRSVEYSIQWRFMPLLRGLPTLHGSGGI